MNRIDRLTAILIQLQSKRIVKAEEIAERFDISLRTVYRDVKALMEAGVPIGSEAGKGYFIVDGYHLPPVMFSQEEASALITAGKLVEKMTDQSIRKAYESALLKIKSVLNESEKDHLENLQASIEVLRYPVSSQYPNEYMTTIQKAVSQKHVLLLEYVSNSTQEFTRREVEPIGVVYYSGYWHLIGWCRLRNGYRDFRIDMIQKMTDTGEVFDARNLYTLQEYSSSLMQSHREMEKVVVRFRKPISSYLKNGRYYYGFVSEEELEDKVRMTFLTGHLPSFCRWLLTYGNAVELESPERAFGVMEELLDQLVSYYKPVLNRE